MKGTHGVMLKRNNIWVCNRVWLHFGFMRSLCRTVRTSVRQPFPLCGVASAPPKERMDSTLMRVGCDCPGGNRGRAR